MPVFGVGEHEGTAYYVMQFIPGVGLDLVLDDLRRIRLGARLISEANGRARISGARFRPQNRRRETRLRLTAVDVAQSLVTGNFVIEGGGENGAAREAGRAGDADSPPIRVRDRFSASSGSVFEAGSSQLSALSPTDRRFYFGVARIGIQVAEALEYANGLGVLHRDIKPSNLLLDPLGNVWVTDFGLAKIAETEELTLPGDVVGTIRYMAPERFRGKCDARSDIYSLGLTLYELVSTKPAFEASDRHELIRKVMHENPAPLKRLAHSVPSDLETIIKKAIAREPDERYPTAKALAGDLRRFIERRPILARRISLGEQAWRWCRRNPVVAGLTAALVVALTVGSALSTKFAIKAGREAVLAGKAADRSRDAERKAVAAENVARNEAETTRHALYDADMQLAAKLWEGDDGTARQVRDLLLAHEPRQGETDLRDFAWHFQRSLMEAGKLASVAPLSGVPISYRGTSSPRLAFAGGRLMVLYGKAELGAWDVQARREVYRIALGEDRGPRLSVLSPDGRVAAGVGEGGISVRLVEATGRELGTLATTERVSRIAFSPDGRTVAATSNDQTTQISDIANLARVRKIATRGRRPFDLAVSGGGRLFALANYPENLHYALFFRGAARPSIIQTASAIICIAFSPDERFLTAGDSYGRVLIQDVNDLRRPIDFLNGHVGPVTGLAFSPDGTRLASGSSDGRVVVWDLPTMAQLRRLKGHLAPVGALAFSADGRHLASADNIGEVRTWEIGIATDVKVMVTPPRLFDGCWTIACSRDGRYLATGHSKLAWLWDAHTGRTIRWLPVSNGYVTRVAFSPDGRTLATGDAESNIKLWDRASGRLLHILFGWPPGPLVTKSHVGALQFSPDGTRLAAGFGSSTQLLDEIGPEMVKVWDCA